MQRCRVALQLLLDPSLDGCRVSDGRKRTIWQAENYLEMIKKASATKQPALFAFRGLQTGEPGVFETVANVPELPFYLIPMPCSDH